MKFEIFGVEIDVTDKAVQKHVKDMRRSDQLSDIVSDRNENQLLCMLAIEKHTKQRTFVLERLYIKYKKARERREKIELLTTN